MKNLNREDRFELSNLNESEKNAKLEEMRLFLDEKNKRELVRI